MSRLPRLARPPVGVAFPVPEEPSRTLMETHYLLRSPADARALLESIAQVEEGHALEHALIDPGP